MLRDASRRAWAAEASALASGRDAPQHEGIGEHRAFWPNEAKDHLAIRVVPAKAGTHDHRRWLWVPALPSLSRGSAGTTIAWSERSTNLRLCEMTAGQFHCLWIVIYNEWCNSNVSVAFERSNSLHGDMVKEGPVSPSVVIPYVTIRRHNVLWI